jgi:hypothetical protein
MYEVKICSNQPARKAREQEVRRRGHRNQLDNTTEKTDIRWEYMRKNSSGV